jgi:LCP family protein required for cell wall assembly
MKQTLLNKKTILIGSIALVTVLLAVGGFALASTLDKIKNDPQALFNQTPVPADSLTTPPPAEPTPADTGETAPSETPAPTETEPADPYDALNGQADTAITAQDTLNVLLIGVDWEEDRLTQDFANKEYFNSDVMLLLSINFKKNKVDMISFPRDSYARIHNMEGIYKLNFSLSAGGGLNDNGFMNVCKSVQDELGGSIPINYYIAVTMPSVKKLVDDIGGVDYNVDIDYKIGDRPAVKKGLQHMDGQMVLDYCRVRKSAGSGYISAQPGDLNRVNRQKKMLVAIFQKLQKETSLAQVPSLLLDAKNGSYTNMNLSQLAALALFGKDLPGDNISMHTMTGSTANVFNYGFVLIDQKKRVQLIKDVFGVTVEPQYKYDPAYARLLWAYMEGQTWADTITHLMAKDKALTEPKIIDPDLSDLKASVAKTNELLSKYRTTIKANKPVVKTAEYTELQKQISAMQTLAKTIFAKTGYKNVSWFVNVPQILKSNGPR